MYAQLHHKNSLTCLLTVPTHRASAAIPMIVRCPSFTWQLSDTANQVVPTSANISRLFSHVCFCQFMEAPELITRIVTAALVVSSSTISSSFS